MLIKGQKLKDSLKTMKSYRPSIGLRRVQIYAYATICWIFCQSFYSVLIISCFPPNVISTHFCYIYHQSSSSLRPVTYSCNNYQIYAQFPCIAVMRFPWASLIFNTRLTNTWCNLKQLQLMQHRVCNQLRRSFSKPLKTKL